MGSGKSNIKRNALKVLITLFVFTLSISGLFGQKHAEEKQMVKIVQENWARIDMLFARKPSLELIENKATPSAESIRALSGRGYELKGKSVFAMAYVYEDRYKAREQADKWSKKLPFPVEQHYLAMSMDVLVFVFTNREDEDAEWDIATLLSAFMMEE